MASCNYTKPAPCVAETLPGRRYCAVHDRFRLADGETCAVCTKKIKTGTFAELTANGSLRHHPECPKREK